MAGGIKNRVVLEHGLAGLFFALGTLVLIDPLSVHPASRVRDPGDPLLFAWILAWMTKAIFSDPLHLFQANVFYPFPDSLAFTDAPLAIVPIAAPVIWLTGNPVLAVNVATLVAFVLSGFFTYLLARYLTQSAAAGIVAGIVFAFAPYKIAHLGHLQLLTSQWMPLALLFLHRGLASRRWRDFGGFAVCFVLQSLSALYYMLFLAVAVGLFALYFAVRSPRNVVLNAVARSWEGEPPCEPHHHPARTEPRTPGITKGHLGFLFRLFIAWACAGLLMVPFLLPYRRAQRTYGFSRTLAEVEEYSADLEDYLAVPPDNRLGGLGLIRENVEHCLYLGLQPMLLAIAGLCLVRRDTRPADQAPGDATRHREDRPPYGIDEARSRGYYLVLGGCAFLLSLGPKLQAFGHQTGIALPYLLLFRFVPGFHSIRVPARLGVLVCLAVAVLAGYGVARLEGELKEWGAGRWLRRAIAAAMALIVIAEYASFPLSVVPIEVGPRIPPVYRWLAEQEPDAIVVELPADDDLLNSRYAYFSTYHWRRLVNGNSSFIPEPYVDIVRRLDDFPSRDAVDLLNSLKVRLVVLHGDFFSAERFRRMQARLAGNPELVHVGSFGDDHVYRVTADPRTPG